MVSTSHPRDINGIQQRDRVGGRAIVIGTGIGGLLAGRSLADRFAEVLLIERDILPAVGEQRKGVPQGHHVHGLMARGHDIIERLFPGITGDLVRQGALMVNATADILWFQGGGYHATPHSTTSMLALSRPLLEGSIRERVRALDNVRIEERRAVRGLWLRPDGSRVTGVRVEGDAAMGGDEILPADLVVDASGRGSRLPAWLRLAGYDEPVEQRSGVEVRYATRSFRRSPQDLAGKLVVVIAASPELPRGAVMVAQEDGSWRVTLAGRHGEQPPTDLPGFIDYAWSLAAPEVAQVVSTAKPIGDASVYGFRSNQRRRYEGLARFPAGLLPFADSLCAFNPIYAQGMSVAAIEAEALQRCLVAGTADLAGRFFAAIAPDLDDAWQFASAADSRFVTTPIALPRKARVITWYMDRLHIAARSEPAVSIAFREVVNLNQRPSSLLRPAVATRVLRGNLPYRRASSYPVKPAMSPAPPVTLTTPLS